MRKSRLQLVTTDAESLYLPERFWNKVTMTDTCWLWTGANTGRERTHPYGVVWDGAKRVKAHRWAFMAAGGRLDGGMEPDHLCRRSLCVRPSHMEAVTRTENVMRSDAPGPKAVRLNQCKRGHEFTPENTIQRGPRHRECRACKKMHAAKWSAARAERRTA
jgi:hypothetical protein